MKTMKVQVLMSDELVKRIDTIANAYGVSRSSYCAMLIGQGILATERSLDILDKMSLELTGHIAPDMVYEPAGAKAPSVGREPAPQEPKTPKKRTRKS